ncbi:MAG: hypothetical protein HY942_06080 [Gammaproteobacteria bacterium]|jgi:hypothetical protein|nr:hypothetical protein [Gammaproteobacteria bacterium]
MNRAYFLAHFLVVLLALLKSQLALLVFLPAYAIAAILAKRYLTGKLGKTKRDFFLGNLKAASIQALVFVSLALLEWLILNLLVKIPTPGATLIVSALVGSTFVFFLIFITLNWYRQRT